MSNKSILLILLVATVLISGCIVDKGKETTNPNKSELIPTTNLPDGFTYIGIHETPIYLGNSSINATEGIYRNNGEDFYIQVIENDKPETLITQYKQQYKNVRYDPFKEISLNGHKATQVTDYSTVNGQQKPNYAVIWATEKAMIVVSSSTADIQTVIALATATGS